jgi:hypothetical protein
MTSLARHTTPPVPPHEAQLDGRSADSGRTGAGDAEPALSRRARRRARCLARRTRSLCHLTGLRPPRPTTATVTPYRTTSVRTASTTPVREGPRRPAVRETVRERQWQAQRNGEGSHHDRISGGCGRGLAGYSPSSSDTPVLERSVLVRAGTAATSPGIRRSRWARTAGRSRPTDPSIWRGSPRRMSLGCRALASPRRQQTTAFLRSRYVPSSPRPSPEIARLGVGDGV